MNEDIKVLIGTILLLPEREKAEVFETIDEMHRTSIIDRLSKLAAGCAGAPVDKRVAKFVQLRDLRAASNKKNDAVDATYKATLEAIERSLLAEAQAAGVTGFKTPHGTTYTEERTMASIADDNAFFDFVRSTGDLDFFERRIKTAHIKEWSEANGGVFPPGLNVFRELTMKVRRS